MKCTLAEYCRAEGKEYLLNEWDKTANGDTQPDKISYGSSMTIWWTCGKGHTWQSPVSRRTIAEAGCPYCSHRIIAAGEGLDCTHPQLASQWNRAKNIGLSPGDVSAGSHKSVWWQCEKGHEWQATVKSRTEGNGCPYCAGKVLVQGINDLASTHPEAAADWHPSRNGELTPADVMAGSSRRVWWRCTKGHEWRSPVNTRSRGSGCPVCANRTVEAGENDLASASPLLVSEWSYEKNAPLRPEDVSAYSSRRIWWECDKGHQWRATVAARMTDASGCPYCAGRKVLAGFNDLETTHPGIASEWHPYLNGSLTPEKVTHGSTKKVWWQCPEGHSWQAYIHARTGQGTGCPECAGRMKIAERNRIARMKLETERYRSGQNLSAGPPMNG